MMEIEGITEKERIMLKNLESDRLGGIKFREERVKSEEKLE